MEEFLDKKTELERKEWLKVFRSKWYLELPERIKQIVKQYPPFFTYKLKSTGHLAIIKEFGDDKEDHEAPVFVVVKLLPKYNQDLIFERDLWGVPLSDLEHVEMRMITDMKKRVTSGDSPFMKRLINTRDREDVLRGNKGRT